MRARWLVLVIVGIPELTQRGFRWNPCIWIVRWEVNTVTWGPNGVFACQWVSGVEDVVMGDSFRGTCVPVFVVPERDVLEPQKCGVREVFREGIPNFRGEGKEPEDYVIAHVEATVP